MSSSSRGTQRALRRTGFRLVVATATSLSVVAGVTVAPHAPIVPVANAVEPPLAANKPDSFKDTDTWKFYATALGRSGTVVAIPGGRYAVKMDYNLSLIHI